jgi:hypothetical protein
MFTSHINIHIGRPLRHMDVLKQSFLRFRCSEEFPLKFHCLWWCKSSLIQFKDKKSWIRGNRLTSSYSQRDGLFDVQNLNLNLIEKLDYIDKLWPWACTCEYYTRLETIGKTGLGTRVTRLGEFSPIRPLITLARFFLIWVMKRHFLPFLGQEYFF